MRRMSRPRDVGIVVVQLLVSMAITVTGACSLFGRTVLAPLVPRSADLSVALWTGVVVAAMGGWLIDATRGVEKPIEALVQRSANSIETETWSYAQRRCVETRTDWRLFRSILLFENLQRPRWVREAERKTAWLRKDGTYGILQTTSKTPLSDIESIERALELHLGGSKPRKGSEFEYHEFRKVVLKHNPSDEYADSVWEVYGLLADD
jgi:hypothetical protein